METKKVKKPRRIGIQLKFIALISAILFCVFLPVSLLVIRQNTQHLRQNLHDESIAFSTLSVKPFGDSFILYKDSGRIRIAQEISTFTSLNPAVTNVTIVDLNGQSQFSLNDNLAHSITADQASSFKNIELTNKSGELQTLIVPYLEDFGAHRYTIVYDISSADIHTQITQLIKLTLISSMIALLITAVVTYLLIARIFISPIQKVQKAAIAVSEGQYETQITLDRSDQIGDLALAVNSMAAALEADISKLKEGDELKNEFIMLTSHNLRTPLTIMSGYLEILKDSVDTPEMQRLVDAMISAQKRLGDLAEEMLTVADIESKNMTINLKPEDIQPVLQELQQTFTPLAAAKGITLQSDLQINNQQVRMNKSYLRNALWQLIENALKFTDSGGKIDFSAQQVNDQVQIIISDNGVGIATDQLDRLFVKFHRGTDTMQFNYEGAGMGLYVAKLLIDQHHGTIKVQSTLHEGTKVIVELPLA